MLELPPWILKPVVVWLCADILIFATVWYAMTVIKPRFPNWWKRVIVDDDPEQLWENDRAPNLAGDRLRNASSQPDLQPLPRASLGRDHNLSNAITTKTSEQRPELAKPGSGRPHARFWD